jgi:hypothetical protein
MYLEGEIPFRPPLDSSILLRVMSRLVDIPRLEQRLKTHITTLTWEESSLRLESKLDSLGEAVAELRDESCLPSLKEIFSLILAIGLTPSRPLSHCCQPQATT